MTRLLLISSWLLLLLSVGCGSPSAPTREWTPADHGQPAAPEASDERAAPDLAAGEDPERRAARALFTATCAGCHGRDGRGQGEQRPPVAQIPDFTAQSWQASRSDEQLAKTIVDGRGMMPPFGKQINPQGIAALVRHIRAFGAPAADPAGAEGATQPPGAAQPPAAADNPTPHP